MKKMIARAMVLFFVLGSTFAFSATPDTQKLYTIDPNHSYAEWHISHFGFSNPSGKWFANGSLKLDEAKSENSQVNVTINTADMVTGIPELDKHLKSEKFFDVAKYPSATFVSTKVRVTGKSTAKVDGILTLHGISKPITLEVKLEKLGMSPIANKQTAGFSADAMLKRSDFGISEYLPGLGDDVKLHIEVEANKNP